MSVEATRSVMEGYLEALVRRGDFAEYFADDVSWTTMETGDQVTGREAVRDFIVWFHTQAFDARPELRSLLVADGAAAVEAVFVGTHTGDFGGVPTTGAKLCTPYSMVYDVDRERITALRGYMSLAAMVAELQAAAG